jgi:Derlin-2/3
MLVFALMIGNSVLMDLIGICVGHAYYFLEYVYPVLADIRGWPIKRIMEPPSLLKWICGTYHEGQEGIAQVHLRQD